MYAAEFEYRSSTDNAQALGIRVSANQANDDIDQLQANFAGFDFAHTRRDSFDAQVDLPEFANHAVSFGLQYSDENTDANSFGTAFDENTSVTQAFVQDQFEIGRVSSRIALGGVDHETFGSELTWNAEVGVGFDTGTRITLSGGKAFRAPDTTDRFGFGGNPDLQPECRDRWNCRCGRSWANASCSTVSAFDNKIRDLINYFVVDPETFEGENRNIDRARIKGVELGWAFHGEAWHARAS